MTNGRRAAGKSLESREEMAQWPARATNLARRLLQLERELHGRGRLQIDLLMVDGEWWMEIRRPGKLERLGDE